VGRFAASVDVTDARSQRIMSSLIQPGQVTLADAEVITNGRGRRQEVVGKASERHVAGESGSQP
jgi:hypothetical protein